MSYFSGNTRSLQTTQPSVFVWCKDSAAGVWSSTQYRAFPEEHTPDSPGLVGKCNSAQLDDFQHVPAAFILQPGHEVSLGEKQSLKHFFPMTKSLSTTSVVYLWLRHISLYWPKKKV